MTAMRGDLPTYGDEPLGHEPLRSSLAPGLEHVGAQRRLLAQWLSDERSGDQRSGDIVLVFSELLTNAVEASPANAKISFCARRTTGEITVTVLNERSTLQTIEPQPMPKPAAEAGRGLALAEAYSDKLEIHASVDTVEVSATFVLARQDSEIL